MEVALKDIRPPTPGMTGGELHQWRERIYKALVELADALGVDGGGISFDHDDLDNNGGSGSHSTIANHMSSTTAHGAGSKILGQTDIKALISESTSNLKHGEQVDNPTEAHGVSEIVGASEVQIITNKTIIGSNNRISGLRHGVEVDNSYTNVHGVVGEVVGTLNPQLLVRKLWSALFRVLSVDDDATLGDEVINIDTSAVTLTLPLAASAFGYRYFIINSSTGDITVEPQAGETINDETSQTVPAGSTMVVQSLETEWRIV